MTDPYPDPYSALMACLCASPTRWLPSQVREVLGVDLPREVKYRTRVRAVDSGLICRWLARLEHRGVMVELTASPYGWLATWLRGGVT